MNQYGPTLSISNEIHKMKYRGDGETFYDCMTRIADALKDNEEHFRSFRGPLLNMRFLPAGRIQSAMGSPRKATAINCFVSGIIPDNMFGIMDKAKEAAETMRLGGGIGYNFCTLRPRGDIIKSIDAKSSGPISFMDIFDAVCATVASAGHRRGAQMAVLRVDYPDIEEFISSKQNTNKLTNFNISVGVTDEFMLAVEFDDDFDLNFDGKVYKTVSARFLWDKIMRSTWDYAEPGVIYLDRINEYNNLWYCENISATNPCSEQPLPPYGACLLGSFNLVKYLTESDFNSYTKRGFDWNQFHEDITHVIRAMDNVIDRTIYPLPEQKQEQVNKRRLGIGITGLANYAEALGYEYGSKEMLDSTEQVLTKLRDRCYTESALLAKEKGSFPLFDKEKYLEGKFIKTLPQSVRDLIEKYGIRNSHLLSIAPTGTISLCADNISSGIEPVYAYNFDRTIQTFDGPVIENITDYGLREFGIKGKRATELSANDHLNVLLTCQKYIDSAVSKTCNVSPDMPWEDFKAIYFKAWKGGAKGCSTFNPGGKRQGILAEKPMTEEEAGLACYVDPTSGLKECE